MKLSNKTYDTLKWIAQIFLPALITLYGTVALALGTPYIDVVVTILGAIDAFLGTILGISTSKYNEEQAAINKEKGDNDHGSTDNTGA